MLIRELLSNHTSHLRIDSALAKNIARYKHRVISRSGSVFEFYNGGKIGTTNLYYTDSLVIELTNDILKVDTDRLKQDYKLAPGLNADFEVLSEPMNLLLFYLAHRFWVSPLSLKIRSQAVKDLIGIFLMRTLEAIHSKGFKFLTTDAVADATWEALSAKFITKKTGSWIGYINHRTEILLDPTRVSLAKLEKFGPDKTVYRLMSGVKGAIKSTFKLVYRTMVDVSESEGLLTGRSHLQVLQEKVMVEIADSSQGLAIDQAIAYTQDRSLFLNRDSIAILIGIVPGISERQIVTAFTGLHEKMLHPTFGLLIRELFTDSLTRIYTILQSSNLSSVDQRDPTQTISVIKGAIGSSRSKDNVLLELRERHIKLYKKLKLTKDTSLLSRIRMSVFIHLYLLSILKRG